MSKKQIEQFNRMRNALIEISKHYATPEQLRKGDGSFGLGYEEALEMAYENIQTCAKNAVKNVRYISPNPTTPITVDSPSETI